MNMNEIFEKATIRANSVDEIDRAHINELLDKNDFAIVEGLISPDEIIKAKASIAEQFDVANDHAATGEKPSELFNNYQKLSIGGGELRRKDLAKCIRTYYNPIFTEDIFGMHNAFRQAARVRNLIMGVDLDFAIDKIEDGFWTAARVHHYPTGGGFMQEHVDDYIPEFYAGTQIDTYYQPLIVMSRRGEGDSCDYSSGGGFFSLNRERIYI